VSQRDVPTTRIQTLLNSIKAKTPNTETEIADTTAKARYKLEQTYGVQMTNYGLLRKMDYIIPDTNAYEYSELVAWYIASYQYLSLV
jgi:hypothetical protein